MTIYYWCDTSRDIIWCPDFGPLAPSGGQNLDFSYLGFLRSTIVIPKHLGPRYMYPLWINIFTFLASCDNTVPVWHYCFIFLVTLQMRKTSSPGSTRSVIVVPKQVGCSCTLFESMMPQGPPWARRLMKSRRLLIWNMNFGVWCNPCCSKPQYR